MKFKNLPTEQLQILNDKRARACESWAKNPVLHSTVDTYTEAYFKGAKHALSLPVMSFSDAASILTELELQPDKEWCERAWKAIQYGDAETAVDALELTEKVDPPSDLDPAEKTPAAASQEPADTDKEDSQ